MKALTIILILVTSFSVTGQIKTTTTASADGSKSANFSLELGKPRTTVTSQVNFEYPNGITVEPIVYKKGANRKTYILVANESAAGINKFEIDIFTGNKKLPKSTLLVWLSANSPSKGSLTNGTYKYSNKGPADRQEYEFSGTVKLGEVDVPITDGTLTVSSWDKSIKIKYNLILNNGVKTTGEYNSEYQKEDRRGL